MRHISLVALFSALALTGCLGGGGGGDGSGLPTDPTDPGDDAPSCAIPDPATCTGFLPHPPDDEPLGMVYKWNAPTHDQVPVVTIGDETPPEGWVMTEMVCTTSRSRRSADWLRGAAWHYGWANGSGSKRFLTRPFADEDNNFLLDRIACLAIAEHAFEREITTDYTFQTPTIIEHWEWPENGECGPLVPPAEQRERCQLDTDHDGRRDFEDTDDDNDGTEDWWDSCPLDADDGCREPSDALE